MTAKETRLPVPLGSVIAGRYRVDHVIGVGGMGIVVAATHLQLEQPIAIKFLQPDALASSEVVGRFMREARAAVRIKSEHVARVLDVGALESGAPYMVMERLEGNDLAALLRARGRVSLDTVVDYVLQALDAIAEAHSLGIVHRDLKPANLFLVSGRRTELVKVLDFGISKTISATGSAGSGMTEPTAVFGTPAYMSPEQLNSARDADARADIWSLGIILYELLAGEAPFRADTVPQLCVAIMNHPTPALRMIRGDVPPGFEAAIERCLQKDRQQRYSTAEELAIALAEFAPPHSRALLDRLGRKDVAQAAVSSRPSGDTLTAPPAQARGPMLAEDSTQSQWGGTARGLRPSPGRRAVVVAMTLAGVVAGAIAAVSFARQRATTADLPSNVPGSAAEPIASDIPSSGRPDPSSAAGATRANIELGEPSSVTTPGVATEQPSVAPRSSSEKAMRPPKPRPGGAAKTPPAASSARTPEPRKTTPERWEDER
jgi:serine/threonine-protein kinase